MGVGDYFSLQRPIFSAFLGMTLVISSLMPKKPKNLRKKYLLWTCKAEKSCDAQIVEGILKKWYTDMEKVTSMGNA